MKHVSVDPCRREKWNLLFAWLELSRLKCPEECGNAMHFPFYINLCGRSQFIFGHAGVISHSLYCCSFYPTSEKTLKVKSCVNSLKSDMFKMQNTCYSLFKFCLISQQQWGNSGKHLFSLWSCRGKHLSAFSSEVLYMQQAVRLQWRWRQDANQSDCFTCGPTSDIFTGFFGTGWRVNEKYVTVWANGFPKHRGTKVHTEERGRTPGPTWI